MSKQEKSAKKVEKVERTLNSANAESTAQQAQAHQPINQSTQSSATRPQQATPIIFTSTFGGPENQVPRRHHRSRSSSRQRNRNRSHSRSRTANAQQSQSSNNFGDFMDAIFDRACVAGSVEASFVFHNLPETNEDEVYDFNFDL